MERAAGRRGLSVPQTGRRERKKRAARSAILDASTRLFVERGFEGTRIETIASDADVGVGTVYNHFATKADILVAILMDDVAEVVVATSAIVERGRPSVAGVVGEAVGVLLDVMQRRPRNLWRDLVGHALLDDGALGFAYRRAEATLFGVVGAGFERLRANGCIEASLEPEDAVGVAFALAKSAVYRFIFELEASADDVVSELERRLTFVFPAAVS